ncbi:hypothetical protein BX600DRAFT_520090 [Xylariales sp. PMI_506]|nr:hypothetical protein BX600DRAFT_520090 [Xylariales sp. PMI_506]
MAPNTLSTHDHVDYLGHGEDEPIGDLAPARRQAYVASDRPLNRAGHNSTRYIRDATSGEGIRYPNMRNYVVQLNALHRLQEGRALEVTPRSLVAALLWEQTQLGHRKSARRFLREIEQLDAESYPFSRGMRDAEYVFMPYQFREEGIGGSSRRYSVGRWATIVLRIEEVEFTTYNDDDDQADGSDIFDRAVTDVALIDPDPDEETRLKRSPIIYERLPKLLARGRIQCSSDCWWPELRVPALSTENMWATGHVSYAVCRELYRRIRGILHRGERGAPPAGAGAELWAPLEEEHDPDYYRKLMVGACAHRVIEKSEHYGRIAIELPGWHDKQASYDAAAVRPPPRPSLPRAAQREAGGHGGEDDDDNKEDGAQVREAKCATDYDDDERHECKWWAAQVCTQDAVKGKSADPAAAREPSSGQRPQIRDHWDDEDMEQEASDEEEEQADEQPATPTPFTQA